MSKKVIVVSNGSSSLHMLRRELLLKLLEQHHVHIITRDSGYIDELLDSGCQVTIVPMDRRGINPVTDGRLLLRYWKLLRREKPDLVMTYTIKPNIYGGMVCRLLGIPYAVNITGLGTAFQNRGALRALVTLLYKTALKKARVVFFENAGNMQVLLDAGIVRRDQCHLLSGAGVNVDRYAFTPYPQDETVTRFLFVGRVMREKGVDELFDTMSRLCREGYSCVLDVLGGYEENYADRIAAYTAEGWMHYHGYQKDVRPFIENAHCFVLPSWHEGMANTNLECAAMGRPLITSNIHGCKEAVVENVSGLLCEPKNADSLYRAMKRFLAMSTPERATMGAAGRRHMEEVFDKKKVVEDTVRGMQL